MLGNVEWMIPPCQGLIYFLKKLVERIFPLVTSFKILLTVSLDDILILLGENQCWSLWELKG